MYNNVLCLYVSIIRDILYALSNSLYRYIIIIEMSLVYMLLETN